MAGSNVPLLANWYERQIGTPTTDDEVNGYWLFVFGVLLGIVGTIVFFLTEPTTTARGLGYAFAALAPPFLMLGAVIRFPLAQIGTYLGYAGAIISFAAVIWFISIFPDGWSTTTGHSGVIQLYGLGLIVLGVVGAFVPMVGPTRSAPATAEASTDEDSSPSADAPSSQARFELYEDNAGQHRWRLRHRNGNVIADSGQGYTRRTNAQNGMASVRRNAAGAGLIDLDDVEPEDADEPEVAVAGADSRATFDLYEDNAGEYRWRLRHENGNILADSGEGYGRRSEAERAIERVSSYAGPARYLWADPTAFEVYEDRAGEYRWRLIHRNGNILADSGQGYTRAHDARKGARRLREGIDGFEMEVYSDAAGEHRWRLRSENGRIVADSGQGYASEQGAEEASDAMTDYATEADILEIGDATFEIFEDNAGESRWRLRHRNGRILADSGQGYTDRSGARDGIERVKRHAGEAPVAEE